MSLYKSALILTFIACVESKIEPPFSSCNNDDTECLRTAKQSFISKTANGIEEIDIKPIDPLEISSVIISDAESELVFYFHNTTITGLKDLKISDYKQDADKKIVHMGVKTELTIKSDVEVEAKKLQKTFNGNFSSTASVTESIEYTYTIIDIEGTEHYELGMEAITCNVDGEPKLSLKVTLQDDSDKESFAKIPKFDKAALRKKTICQITDKATAVVVHNLRAAAKAFPKSAYVNDD